MALCVRVCSAGGRTVDVSERLEISAPRTNYVLDFTSRRSPGCNSPAHLFKVQLDWTRLVVTPVDSWFLMAHWLEGLLDIFHLHGLPTQLQRRTKTCLN